LRDELRELRCSHGGVSEPFEIAVGDAIIAEGHELLLIVLLRGAS